MTEIMVAVGMGWLVGVLTGAVGGLYFGERGRRIDLAYLTRMHAGPAPPAEVSQTYDAEAEAINMFTEDDRSNFISELVASGHTEEEAKEELNRLLRATALGSQTV